MNLKETLNRFYQTLKEEASAVALLKDATIKLIDPKVSWESAGFDGLLAPKLILKPLDYRTPYKPYEWAIEIEYGLNNSEDEDGLVKDWLKQRVEALGLQHVDVEYDDDYVEYEGCWGRPAIASCVFATFHETEGKKDILIKAARQCATDLQNVRSKLSENLPSDPELVKADHLTVELQRWEMFGSDLSGCEYVVLMRCPHGCTRSVLALAEKIRLVYFPVFEDSVECVEGMCFCGAEDAHYLFWAFRKKVTKVKNQKQESEFEIDFHKCLVSDAPLYDAFLKMSQKRLPPDADARYQRLRTTGFVMTDESDIDVYTQRVAGKHIPKFKWLYANLFDQYRSVFTAPVGLVVWGCGCGLDLIALYDQAMKQGNPNFWIVVQDIVLVDISEAAMNRAREIAGLLFPTASITCKKLDLTKTETFNKNGMLEYLFSYTTRIHLLSNVIDLFDDAEPFARALMAQSGRLLKKGTADKPAQWMWNEVFIAFSPEYRSGRVRQNMAKFRSVWNGAVDLTLSGDLPQNCEFAAFSYNSLKRSPAYKAFVGGNPLVRRMIRRFGGETNSKQAIRIMRALCTTNIGDKPLAERYEFFDEFSIVTSRRTDGGQRESVDHRCLYCIAGCGQKIKPLLILREKTSDDNVVLRTVERFFDQMEDIVVGSNEHGDWEKVKEEETALRKEKEKTKKGKDDVFDVGDDGRLRTLRKKLLEYVVLVCWSDDDGKLMTVNGNLAETELARTSFETDVDYSGRYVIVPDEIAALPALSDEQRRVADSRKQLRKIKGGPGVGKTVTMLWHALRAVERTHLPVLILCKTVSLINYNRRRLAATYLASHPEERGMDVNLFRFETIDDFLCSYVKKTQSACVLRKCGNCLAHCARHKVFTFDNGNLKTEADRKRDAEVKERFNCKKCHRNADAKAVCSLLGCKDVPIEQLRRRTLSESFLSDQCRKCKTETVKNLKRKVKNRTWEDEIGAVLVDEAQIADPDYLKSVYNLTLAGNRWREFYMFCDAQQAFRHNSLEQDGDTRKWEVKVPDTGFGSFDVLKQNFRMKSRSLIEVCRIIQQKLKGKDEDLTLFDWTDISNDGDVGTGAFGIKSVKSVDFSTVDAEVTYLHDRCGAESVTVICDEESMVRRMSGQARKKDWIITHLPVQSYALEKELRKQFYEHQGCNHLTSIDCAQGQSFETVVFILSSNREQLAEGVMEHVFTALSRSGRFLRVMDASPAHWLYELLKGPRK